MAHDDTAPPAQAEDRISAREAALREVLDVINRSRDDERPVFDAILRNAARLCDATQADLELVDPDGRHLREVATWGEGERAIPSDYWVWPMDSDFAVVDAVRTAQVSHTPDLRDTDKYRSGNPMTRAAVDSEGMRTALVVPLISEARGVGCIVLFRQVVKPFSAKEIALAETFAAQAVIAIENVRQFRDVQTRLRRERASAEILNVISQSREDETPVFDVILENACALCDAPLAGLILGTPQDSVQTLAAHRGMFSEAVELFETGQMRMDGDLSYAARSILEGRVIAFTDMGESDLYTSGSPVVRSMVDASNIRSVLFVPLMKDGAAIGNITLFRREIRPFDPSEIALVETFAAQAVIAIENVRQFREVQTRLEREAASREILQVISASRTDPAPVFDVILQNAAHLSGAPLANLCLLNDAKSHWDLVAHFGDGLRHLAVGAPPRPLDSDLVPGVAMRTAQVVHIEDLTDTDMYRQGDPGRVAMVEEEGMRTILGVPLLNDAGAIGCITLFRREVKAFTNDEIALVETFAAQAVIAIENVRQFREVQTRLEREAATKEVLQVISQSRDDEMPVFETILKQAERLCHADTSGLQLVTDDKKHLRMTLSSGQDRGSFQPGYLFDLSEPLGMCVAVRERRVVHKEDLKNDDLYRQGHPARRTLVDDEGVLTQLSVPLIKGGNVFGTMTLSRLEQKPFSDDEIALVETFAAQAVIAIENVRQFRDVQTRLDREIATRSILSVISQSRDDVQPVLNEIAARAAALCDASAVGLHLLKETGDRTVMVGSYFEGASHFQVGEEFELNDESHMVRAIRESKVMHVPDIQQDSLYLDGSSDHRRMIEEAGIHSHLCVPLVQNGEAFGCINLNRTETRPFSDSEIALIETFATQAVIAIENVRQFREVQTRLERERASAEVLGVISRSRDDELPVFNSILESVSDLCDAPLAFLSVATPDRAFVEIPAHRGTRSAFGDILGDFREPMTRTELVAVRPVADGQVLRQDDITDDDTYRSGDTRRRQMADVEGARSVLSVPLLREGEAIGAIVLYRRVVAPFSDDDVALVQSFADQAVIAIENVRQFREVQERLEREAATSEVLNVISQSRSDAQPVFRTILENAARLCGAPHAMLLLRNAEDTHLVLAANNAAQSVFIDQIRDTPHRLDNTDSYAVRAVLERRVIHVPDLREAADVTKTVPQIKVALELEGMRTVLQVPLLQGDQAIGVIALYTLEVAPFSEDQIKLVETFAAQAVIAIENTMQLQNLETLNTELGDRVEAQVGELERMGKLKRFLPEQVADAVVSSGDDSMLSSHRALISALFCDIRGFTAFCETAEPEETIEVLQAYHEELGKLIAAHGAGVDHRAGDGIMVLFNDPLPCEDPAGDAVRLAFAMRTTMETLCQRWRKMGHRLGFGVGISLGYATVGMVGSEGRNHYTASGTAVNLAARLCDLAKDGEILLSPRAHIAVEEEIDSELMGEVEIKGISAPVEVYRAVAAKG